MKNLTHIVFTGPVESHLERLTFPEIEFPYIKCLSFKNVHDFIVQNMVGALQWAKSKLNNLERLDFPYCRDIQSVLRALSQSSQYLAFSQSLTTLDFFQCSLNSDDLATLMCDFIPCFPRLSKLGLSHNAIESLQPAAARLKATLDGGRWNTRPPVALQQVKIDNNPVFSRTHPKDKNYSEPENNAIRTLLYAFPKLFSFGYLLDPISLGPYRVLCVGY